MRIETIKSTLKNGNFGSHDHTIAMRINSSDQKRIFAVGDIHGCQETFKHLLLKEFNLQKSDTVVCLGDYVDRGPRSKEVVEFILELRAFGYDIKTLRGNHEQLMLDSIGSPHEMKLWLLNGGEKTLTSFGVKSYNEISEDYKKFFENTFHYLIIEKIVFAHAGLNLEIEDPFEDRAAMLTIRNMQPGRFMDDRILVHGHTPISLKRILSQKNFKIINIDGGCVYSQSEGFGNLVGLDVTNQRFVFTRNRD